MTRIFYRLRHHMHPCEMWSKKNAVSPHSQPQHNLPELQVARFSIQLFRDDYGSRHRVEGTHSARALDYIWFRISFLFSRVVFQRDSVSRPQDSNCPVHSCHRTFFFVAFAVCKRFTYNSRLFFFSFCCCFLPSAFGSRFAVNRTHDKRTIKKYEPETESRYHAAGYYIFVCVCVLFFFLLYPLFADAF